MDHADPNHAHASDVSVVLLANHQRFLRFVESRVGSREDAEDILQSAFVRSIEHADQLRDSESAVAWFYRLLRNAVTDHYRRNPVAARRLETYARQLSDPETIDPDTHRVICACVGDLVPLLKPEYAELLARVDVRGEGLDTAAESLGITPGNARVRIHRARAALRDEVERSCRTCATHGCLDCSCAKSDTT
jgi:RNA polymerase sigma-70 factor (ECF subfamily)